MNSKPIHQSKTVWGLIVSIIFALLAVFDVRVTDADYQQVVEAIGVIAGFAISLYGRIVARVPLQTKKQGASGTTAMLMLLVLPMGLAMPFTGCESMSPALQQSLKETARLAVTIGLQRLGQEVDEVEPYMPLISDAVDSAFAVSTEPGAIGRQLSEELVARLPEAIAMLALDRATSQLVPSSGTTASGNDPQAEYNLAIAAAL
ncbi:MAG: hypothetical protein E1N59_2846 [Puniceicoccaceae bacterium 5H]|nr:MAG: hypothetical protein E1N59_2846 [Puniceicoccaceae bacterium 5H]